MKWFRNLSLAKKLYGLAALPLAMMTAASVSSASSGFETRTVALSAVTVALTGAFAFITVRELRRAVAQIIERLATVEKAAKENLVIGLNALSVGDLTVKLQAKTQPAAVFSKDELGRIMRQADTIVLRDRRPIAS